MVKVKVKMLSPSAVMPARAHSGDAGYDLVAVSRKVDSDGCVVYGTGLAFEIPEGYVGLVFPRSSVAKKDVILSNCVGVVDSGYRGEVMAKFKFVANPRHEVYEWYDVGERIAQMVIVKLPEVEYEQAGELSDSERGEGGYGSSGA